MLKNVSPGLIENVKDLKISLNELTVYDLNVYSSLEIYYKVANKLNEVIRELSRFEGVLSEEVIKQNEKLIYLLGEGLENEVIKEIDNLINESFFDKLLNQKIFNDLNEKLDNKINKGDLIPTYWIDKNSGKFDESFMSDEFLQQITGQTPIHSVPADESITFNKLAPGSLGHSKINSVYGYQMEYFKPTNLINWDDESYISGAYMTVSSGDVKYVNHIGYVTTNLIPCKPGQLLTVSQMQPIGAFFFDITGNKYITKIEGEHGGIGKNITITVPNDSQICYVRFSFQNVIEIEGIKRDNYEVVCYGDKIIPYEKYGFKLKDCKLNANDIDKKSLNKNVMSILNDEIINTNENLFNVNSEYNEKGYFINNGKTGAYKESSHFGVTHFIEVEEGCTYSYTHSHKSFGSNINYNLYDSENNFISTSKVEHIEELIDLGLDTYKHLKITIPQGHNIKYIKLNYPLNDNSMFVKGETLPNTFKKYGSTFKEHVYLNNNQIDDLTSPLLNKIISFNGDSICYGAGYKGGYGKIIADKYNMTYENIGIGGGTITSETYYSSTGDARHWISRTISNMREDADYVVLEGGVNDAGLNVPLGEITKDYTSELNDTTYCGAFESMLKQTIEKYQGKKIGYILVHKMTKNFDSRYENNHYQMSKKICEKWGIPYLDLNIECPPLAYIQSLKETYTKNADGWHPNELGYKKYYVDKIVKWLEFL